MTTAPLLQVAELSVAFGAGEPVVNGQDYSVVRGQTLAIIGESGSGKSVSCSALTGLLPRSARVTGSALLEGQQLIGADEQLLRRVRRDRIGMVFQDPVSALNPAMRIGDQITEPLRLYRGASRVEARRVALRLLDEVGIANAAQRLDNYPHEFSGGMCQRVMIAMALVMEPALVIADEPTSALDVQTQAQILALFARIQRERNIGMVLISHDLGVVADVAQEVVVMQRGISVEQGGVEQIFRRPEHRYTRQLIDAIPSGTKSVGSPVNTDDPLLSVSSLGVSYRLPGRSAVMALQDIDLEIAAGEVLGLVGESGSGKTTLSRCLVGLTSADGGRATLSGTSLLSLYSQQDRSLRKQVQVVFQDPWGSLSPRMTIQQIIAEPLRLHGLAGSADQARQQVSKLLTEVGLDPAMAERFPHQFSGGQRQRIALARAIAPEPALLIADEMVSALDVTVQAQILELLLSLVSDRKLAVLFISHDLAVVRLVADRVVVLKDGVVVESGATEQLVRSPRHEYTRSLVSLAKIGHGPALIE